MLELVRALMAEVHPRASRASATLDRTFDQLGIGSLELVELVERTGEAFGAAIPSQVLASAETPRDLLEAARRSRRTPGARRGRFARLPPLASEAGGQVPLGATTLVEALRWHAQATPQRPHVRILGESGVLDELSYGQLWEEAVAVAAGLQAREVAPADTVAIMLPTGRAYFVTFAGILLAGAIPVPIYPPARPSHLVDHLQRHARILDNAGASLLVTVPEAVSLGKLLRSGVAGVRHVVVPESLAMPAAGARSLPAARADDIALLQYTSGSTGNPKGVVLTHDNLLANIRAMGRAVAVSRADIFVSWLPLYHDLGLIGAWLSSVYFGFPLAVMPPQVFLARPSRWLWAIHELRGTISAGPNFAYELCLRRIDDAELEGLDLSCWRLAFNGAEPVSPVTVERFSERFAPYGLHPETIAPVYGLAECSVGLAFPPLGRAPRIDRVEREPFIRSGRAVSATGSEETGPRPLRFVACGQPLPGHELRIVDLAGNELGDRQEGRIEFRGPSATSGYYHNAQATRALFHGDWLDSGDLGYVADGDVYVTGRVKDVIVRAGRNLHPDELEEAIGNLDGVRKGCVAAFASRDPAGGAERLVIVAETRGTDADIRQALHDDVVATTVDLVGVPPDDVVLVAPRTLLKTSSGKLRRAASRELYERGRLAEPAMAWWHLARLRLRGSALSPGRLRNVAAAVAFAVYATAVFGTIALPTVVLLAVIPRRQWRWLLARRAIHLIGRLTGTSVTVRGLERLPTSTCVAVANHPSWLDGLVLATVLPPSFRFIAGEVFRRQVLVGFVLRRAGVEFVERADPEGGVADTELLAAMVRGGQRLVLFPEGHLTRAPGVRPFHMGAFVIAAQAGVPVVPVVIRGTRSMLRPGHRFLRRGTVHVVIEVPLRPTGADWSAAVELQRAVREVVLRRSGEPDLE